MPLWSATTRTPAQPGEQTAAWNSRSWATLMQAYLHHASFSSSGNGRHQANCGPGDRSFGRPLKLQPVMVDSRALQQAVMSAHRRQGNVVMVDPSVVSFSRHSTWLFPCPATLGWLRPASLSALVADQHSTTSEELQRLLQLVGPCGPSLKFSGAFLSVVFCLGQSVLLVCHQCVPTCHPGFVVSSRRLRAAIVCEASSFAESIYTVQVAGGSGFKAFGTSLCGISRIPPGLMVEVSFFSNRAATIAWC